MIIQKKRNITAEELKNIKTNKKSYSWISPQFFMNWGFCFALGFFSYLGIDMLFKIPGTVDKIVITIILVISFAFTIYYWRLVREVERDVADSKESAKILITKASATRGLIVEEYEDEGVGIFLDVGNGKTLFLQGQYLYEYIESPRQEIYVEHFEKEGSLVEFNAKGETLKIIGQRAAFSPSDFKKRVVPRDGEILDKTLDSIIRKYEKLLVA